MKLETYLRMAGLPFEPVNTGDVLRAPKRKLPFIDDGGTLVADTSFIIDYLKGRYGDPLDAHLSPFEHAQATAFQRLFEENLYWVLIHMRWAETEGWACTRIGLLRRVARAAALVLPASRGAAFRRAAGHGIGRHSAAEIQAIGCRDVTAVADFLADKPFMLGPEPTSLDATAHAFLANLLWAPVESPVRRQRRRGPRFRGVLPADEGALLRVNGVSP